MKQTVEPPTRKTSNTAEPVPSRTGHLKTDEAGGRMAQLAAMMNDGSRVQPLAQLKDAASQSSLMQSLRGLAAEINHGVPADSSMETEAVPSGARDMAAQRQVSGGVRTGSSMGLNGTAQLKIDIFGTLAHGDRSGDVRAEDHAGKPSNECGCGAKQDKSSGKQHKNSPGGKRPLQKKSMQQKTSDDSLGPAQLEPSSARPVNRTGLPDQLNAGVENLSGISPDNVKVHSNSSKPAQLNALAYAQESDIHVVETPLAHMAAGNNDAHPIQRVRVSVERGGNQDANVEPGGPLQRVTVTAVRAGTRISSTKLQTAIAYVTEAVRNAEEQKGKESSGDEHKRLKGLLQNEGTLKPKSSRETFGLGGAQYFPGHPFTTTQGPQGFGTSVAAIGGVGVTEHLGNRPTGLHDEMHQITNYPGLQALASTQGHCIFCYGTIHGRGYQHGEVRPDDPFPQNWKHDYAGFALKQTSENYESSIEYSDCPVIKIESTYGTRYYFVTN